MNSATSSDLYQIHLLSIFHYVLAGITGLMSLFPILHLVMGLWILSGDSGGWKGNGPPAFIGMIFVLFSLVFIIGGLIMAAFMFLAGRNLSRRRRYHFCVVIAGIECLNMPLGTILGIFTIIVLMRPSAKPLFG